MEKNMKLAKFRKVLVVLLCLITSPVAFADFDGSEALICATVEARDCVLRSECFTGEAKEVGAPAFFRLDFDKKVVYGPERTSPIEKMEKSAAGLLLQGSELGFGWVIAIDIRSGDFSGSLTNSEGSFLLFGSCTIL
jgi:hypothetical protein